MPDSQTTTPVPEAGRIETCPDHDWAMPHDSRCEGWRSCPPNCPYLLFHVRHGLTAEPAPDGAEPAAGAVSGSPAGEAVRAQLAVAVAALRRLALDDEMAGVDGRDRDDPEVSARIRYAARTLETIARLGQPVPAEAAETRAEVLAEIAADWTIDPSTGRSNSSDQFAIMCAAVGRMLREQFRVIDRNVIASAAGLVMARLAHVHKLAPAGAAAPQEPDFITRLRMIADQDIGGNAPALADELNALADRIEADARGEGKPEPPLPEGEWARVEILGHDSHTGWVTERTRAGQPVMVISDWDGRVIAEIPGHALYRYVPLATPLKRPDPAPQRARITAGRSDYDEDGDDDADEDADPGWPF